MRCRLTDFDVGAWHTVPFHAGHTLEVAYAATRSGGLDGVVYKLDGVFQGFVFSFSAAIANATERLKRAGEVLQ